MYVFRRQRRPRIVSITQLASILSNDVRKRIKFNRGKILTYSNVRVAFHVSKTYTLPNGQEAK